MILIDTALKKRAAQGQPIKVGMIGAGFMGRAIALQIAGSVPGMVVSAIAARRGAQAKTVFSQFCDPESIVSADSQSRIEAAIQAGHPVITEDPVALARSQGLDAILEVTGSMDYALSGALAAIESGKHVLLMNAELDGSVGPMLQVRAAKAGLVFSNVDGDQPGVQMNLLRFMRGMGVRPVFSGNIKALQDPYRTPITQRAFAEKWGQSPLKVTSFADGTKIAFEQAIVANGAGMRVAKRGMIGIDPTNMDPTQPLRPLEDYVPLLEPYLDPEGPGIVDFIVGARPAPGVFALGVQPDPRHQHYLNLYKLGTGPYYLFYTPYHLCHFEVPNSIARAVLFHDAALAPLGAPRVGVVATAKRDLQIGDRIDDIGGFDTFGEAENIPEIFSQRLLPMGLAAGCTLKRKVARGATLCLDDVAMPPPRLIDSFYQEQTRHFGLEIPS